MCSLFNILIFAIIIFITAGNHFLPNEIANLFYRGKNSNIMTEKNSSCSLFAHWKRVRTFISNMNNWWDGIGGIQQPTPSSFHAQAANLTKSQLVSTAKSFVVRQLADGFFRGPKHNHRLRAIPKSQKVSYCAATALNYYENEMLSNIYGAIGTRLRE